jgi:hypothetical protein
MSNLERQEQNRISQQGKPTGCKIIEVVEFNRNYKYQQLIEMYGAEHIDPITLFYK